MEDQSQQLPIGWAETTLESVVEILDNQRVPINNGEREKRLSKAKELYPYYGATGQVGEIDDFIFEGEAVLLGEDAAPFLEFGEDKAYVVNGKFWVNNHAHILRGLAGIDNKFLCNQLNIINYHPFVSGTTRLKLTQGSMKNILIKIAPLNEQKRIADKIDALFSNLDEGETLLRTVQKQLASYRRSILRAAVTGELTKEWRDTNKHRTESGASLLQRVLKSRRENWKGRGKYQEPLPPNSNNLPNLPKEWIWISPDQVSLMFGNGLSKKPANYETKYPILRISAVRPMSVDASDIRFYEPINNEKLENFWVEKGDLLFTRYNGSGHLVGVCGLYNSNQRILHPDKIIKLRTIDLGDSGRKYLELCLNAGESRAFIKRHVKTTAGQQGIAGSDLKLTPIPLAPPEEQIEIVNIVEEKLAQIDVLENWCETELKRSSTLRQSILKSAFSGKLVPQSPVDEPASTLLARIQSAHTQSAAITSVRRNRKSKASEAA